MELTTLMHERIEIARKYQRTHKGRLPTAKELSVLTGASVNSLSIHIRQLREMDIEITRKATTQERAKNIQEGKNKFRGKK